MFCKPKCRGGLEVRKIIYLNNVLLPKMRSNLMKEESNWCYIMKEKYLKNHNLSHYTCRNDLLTGSKIWGNIVKNIIILKEGVRWLVGNGNQINFQEDSWLTDKPLTKMKFGYLQNHLQEQGEEWLLISFTEGGNGESLSCNRMLWLEGT